MSKADRHVKIDRALDDAISRYAAGHGLNFTAALSVLAARGLRDEGIVIADENGKEKP
jgi:hypothetical protein